MKLIKANAREEKDAQREKRHQEIDTWQRGLVEKEQQIKRVSVKQFAWMLILYPCNITFQLNKKIKKVCHGHTGSYSVSCTCCS